MPEFGDIIERNALGRVSSIGGLYDARADRFLGASIFRREVPPNCLSLTDISEVQYALFSSNSFTDKFSKLDVNGELRVGVLAGLISLSGSGKYLSDSKSSARAVKVTFMYNVKTKAERLNIDYDDLRPSLTFDSVGIYNATHVVTGIDWGANSYMSVEDKNSERKDSRTVEGELKGSLEKMIAVVSVEAKGHVGHQKGNSDTDQDVKIAFYGDVVPEGELPQNFEQAKTVMNDMTNLIRRVNDGRGKPLVYYLMPVSIILKRFKEVIAVNDFVQSLDGQIIGRLMKTSDGLSASKQLLNDLIQDMKQHPNCVEDWKLEEAEERKSELEAEESRLRSSMASKLVKVRSGAMEIIELEELYGNFESSDYTRPKVSHFCTKNFEPYRADFLRKKNVPYVGRGGKLENHIREHGNHNLFILRYQKQAAEENTERWEATYAKFLNMIDQSISDTEDNGHMQHFVFFDGDLAASTNAKKSCTIEHFRHRKRITADLVADTMERTGLNSARSHAVKWADKPSSLSLFLIRCPGSKAGGNCTTADKTWQCFKCKEKLEICPDNGRLYCSCGAAPVRTYSFKCSEESHGADDIMFEPEGLQLLLARFLPCEKLDAVSDSDYPKSENASGGLVSGQALAFPTTLVDRPKSDTKKIPVFGHTPACSVSEPMTTQIATETNKPGETFDSLEIRYNSRGRADIGIGVIGVPRSGVSTFINAATGLTSDSDMAASAEVAEPSNKTACYSHPKVPWLTYWEFPPVGAHGLSHDEYLQLINRCGVFFLLIKGRRRFRNTESELGRAIQEQLHKKVFYVRTHADADVANELRARPRTYSIESHEDACKTVLEKMRAYTKEMMKRHGGQEEPEVYLVNSLDPANRLYDFDNLLSSLGDYLE